MGIETGLAVLDFFRGLLTGKSLLKELKFIASRIAVTIRKKGIVPDIHKRSDVEIR